MKINIVAIGNKMPAWVRDGVEEYMKRLSSDLRLIEIASAKISNNPETILLQEGKKLLAAIPHNHRVVALAIKGKAYNTAQLVERLKQWQMAGRDVSLLIGGANGLSAECLERADETWSLSPLTFPHMLARLIVVEQLYRAISKLNNHPYHR
ncbi:MAG: 23S rRNA (pseudouridine(1915)-N(3))-methyltransferase RlmH [Gammaproteobacteria bacterium RIFCSPHIGHO2_02_FULL_42_13]|nr:MAG: 23S rRNA (pseudouridine(1915)-N(3))-methyltransferase RlmH [Gammaproteobacteria bacterium RIFCSPHIGHO2_02_FULL_42_13]